jgi:hypothetical protein
MPTAKPRYDKDGAWKYRKFSAVQWDVIGERLRGRLRQYYPDRNAIEDATFGHPSDGWVNSMLNEAHSAVSEVLWQSTRLTNEELRAEKMDVQKRLLKAVDCLSNLSHDFDIMLGVDADVLGCRDAIKEILRRVEAAESKIALLPKARKPADAQRDAAIEMAIRVLRVLKSEGGTIAATADAAQKYTSDAVMILKIIGDEVGLIFQPSTWAGHIKNARKQVSDLQ